MEKIHLPHSFFSVDENQISSMDHSKDSVVMDRVFDTDGTQVFNFSRAQSGEKEEEEQITFPIEAPIIINSTERVVRGAIGKALEELEKCTTSLNQTCDSMKALMELGEKITSKVITDANAPKIRHRLNNVLQVATKALDTIRTKQRSVDKAVTGLKDAILDDFKDGAFPANAYKKALRFGLTTRPTCGKCGRPLDDVGSDATTLSHKTITAFLYAEKHVAQRPKETDPDEQPGLCIAPAKPPPIPQTEADSLPPAPAQNIKHESEKENDIGTPEESDWIQEAEMTEFGTEDEPAIFSSEEEGLESME
jgi:hypothetical protein